MKCRHWLHTCWFVLAALCCAVIAAASGAQTTQPTTAPHVPQTAVHNRDVWPDVNGKHINAHGGGVLFHEGTYYWYGEWRNPRVAGLPWSGGVSCYSSTDLYNWKFENVVLPVVHGQDSDIVAGCTIERPKVIYNAKNKQFVMWFHLELRGQGYGAARAALAVSDSPTKPFQYVKSLRPNAGKWPLDLPEDRRTPLTRDRIGATTQEAGGFREAVVAGMYTRRDFEGGQMSRDMTLFVDPDDAKAYHITSEEENFTLNIHELNDDYTDFTGKWTRVVPGGHNEAPAMAKHNGRYYILASGATSWRPNPARVLMADNIWGPYTNVGNPCAGVNPLNNLGPELTFGGQSTHILAVPGKPHAYIAMFDVWRPRNLISSFYIWSLLSGY